MEVTRRDWLGLASAAGAVALAEPLRAQTAAVPEPYREAVARIRAFAAADLADKGFPGMSLALVGPGFSTAGAVGIADIARRTPVTTDHLFQIGSITKSLTDMALFVLAEQGKLDLDGRAQQLLPDHPLPDEPITIVQLMEHSSGLPNSLVRTPFLDVPGGRLWTGFKPGSRYSYCNLGYSYLGDLIERSSGMPYHQALRSLVLAPLGMGRAEPVIRIADRDRYAAGHIRHRDDLPWIPRVRLNVAPWVEFHSAAGSVAATPADMTRYLQYVVQLGRGRGAPLFSDKLAERFRRPTIASDHGPGSRYGHGLAHIDVEGVPCLRHTGGMMGFSSAVTVDPVAGVGAYASVNVGGAGGYRPTDITEYALALLRAAAERRPLPAARTPRPPQPIREAARFVGRWRAADGELAIAERAGALFVLSGGIERPLRQSGPGFLVTDHPALASGGLMLEPGETPVLRVGKRRFGRDAVPAPERVDAKLAALAGTYYSPAGWSGRLTITAVGDRLFFGAHELRPADDGSWRVSDPSLISERLWFGPLVNGQADQLNISGMRYYRLDA